MWSPELKCIDDLLICKICYEYMDTSVTTSCSHNYCSLCIRKYLHYKTQCPICSEETFENELRKNKILDEIIIQFLNIKKKCEKRIYLREIQDENLEIIHDSNKYDSITHDLNTHDLNILECEKRIDVSVISEVISHEVINSPVLAANISTPHREKHQREIPSSSTSTSPRIPSIFTIKTKKGLKNEENYKVVVCPVCKVDVYENNINKHLDDCLKRENAQDQPKKTEEKRRPLPKLVFSLMKVNIIRKKLKELGLPTIGDRKVLENRLQRYIILYNAECDKINPRSVSELIKQCAKEENSEIKSQKPLNRLNVNRNTAHNIIEEERKKYLAANKSSFEQLITKAKTAAKPCKLPVKCNTLSKNNFEIPHNDCIIENDSSAKDNKRDDILSVNSTDFYIDDPDSNASPGINPIDFLAIEVSSSSSNGTHQCFLAPKQEEPEHEQLRNIQEEVDCTKYEEKNIESLDENINIFRKRKHERTFVSSDDERIGNRSTNNRKSSRLSKTKEFNKSGNLSENALQNEEKSHNEKEQSHTTPERSINSFIKKKYPPD